MYRGVGVGVGVGGLLMLAPAHDDTLERFGSDHATLCRLYTCRSQGTNGERRDFTKRPRNEPKLMPD
jgi:hypothetical protein